MSVGRDDDIAYEQGKVDWAYECLERWLERTQEMLGEAGDKGTARMFRDIAAEAEADVRSAQDRLVIGRLDLVEDETFYVGKIGVQGPDREPAVIDWRTPVGGLFYTATMDDSSEVGRRRTIQMRQRQVTGLSDEILIKGFRPPVAPLAVEPPPPEIPVPELEVGVADDMEEVIDLTDASVDLTELPVDLGATEWDPVDDGDDDTVGGEPEVEDDVLEADDSVFEVRAPDLLLDELERQRTGHMAEIVATIQAEQYELVRSDPSTPLLIQGGPGTGKTVVALHRAAWVLYHQRGQITDPSVLVVGPNRRFIDYIRGVLPSLGEGGATRQMSIDELSLSNVPVSERGSSSTFPHDPPDLERLKGDSRWAPVIERAVWSHAAPEPVEFGYGRVIARVSSEEVADLLRRRRARQSWNEARETLIDDLGELLFSNYLGRLGTTPSGVDADALLVAFRRFAGERGIRDRILPPLLSRQVVRELFEDPAFLERVAPEFDREEREQIARAGVRTRWSAADLPLIDEAAAHVRGEPLRFSHVVVDEAQDLSPMQWRVVARRSRQRSVTVAGDLAQATSTWSPTSWEEVVEWAGIGPDVRSGELLLGYRAPVEVMEFATRLLPVCAPTVRAPRSFRSTAKPHVRTATTSRLLDVVVLTVAQRMVDDPGLVALIVPEPRLAQVRRKVAASGLDVERLVVLPDTETKGLEFDTVVLVEPAEVARDGVVGLRRLYVAMTRATQQLVVVHAAPLPADLLVPDDKDARFIRNGLRWKPDEDRMLEWEYSAGWSVDRVAMHHQRRPSAIRARARRLGLTGGEQTRSESPREIRSTESRVVRLVSTARSGPWRRKGLDHRRGR